VLQAFAFERVGVVLGDIYFVDPEPDPGQEGAEHGVRLEVRLMAQPPHDGSVYASRPVLVDRPVWRVDLLETVDGTPGSYDRTHHHPAMHGWEPGARRFEKALSADPLGWLEARLRDLPGLLSEGELPADAVHPDDARQLADAAPRIVASAADLLERVRAGELGTPPEHAADLDDAVRDDPVRDDPVLVRTGWL
jgi:hypothetical protein